MIEHSLGKGEVVSSIQTGSTTSRADHGALSHQLKPHAAEFDAGIRDGIAALNRARFDAASIGDLDRQRAQNLPRAVAARELDRGHVGRDAAAAVVGNERHF